MLCIKTSIGKSKIHGLGLFTDQDIKENTLIGEFVFGIDIAITCSEYKKLNKSCKSFFDTYGWKDKRTKRYMLNIDNTRFINHSTTPNIKHKGYKILASKDIKKGEELADNYNDFDDGFATKNFTTNTQTYNEKRRFNKNI